MVEHNLREDTIIQFPDVHAIQKEISKLKLEISMLILERDELYYVTCKNIETAYMLAIGHIEYQVFQRECEMLRLKRKIELIQAKLNRQEKVDIDEIDAILDKEFIEYETRLEAERHKINDALKRSKGEALTDEEKNVLKKMYRVIVKAMHPDINPNITAETLKLFHNAVEAYQAGDLFTIELIYSLVLKEDAKIDNKSIMHEKDRLLQIIDNIQKEISDIKSRYPYSMQQLLNDEVALNEKKRILEQTIIQLDEMITIYQNKIDAL